MATRLPLHHPRHLVLSSGFVPGRIVLTTSVAGRHRGRNYTSNAAGRTYKANQTTPWAKHTPTPPLSSISPTTRAVSTSQTSSKPLDTTLTLTSTSAEPPTIPHPTTPTHPLSVLPLPTLLRTLLITTISSSPLLLTLTSRVLSHALANTTTRPSRLSTLNPLSLHNPLTHYLLKRTFYAQFCAGETQPEVAAFVARMQKTGYTGIALEYASEVLDDGPPASAAEELAGIERWERGMLESIEMSQPGSFVAFKYSGMGSAALARLKGNEPPTERMQAAIDRVCEAAVERGVRVSPAAEPQNAQAAVNGWTLELARRFNRADGGKEGKEGEAMIYNTYQAYLKSTLRTLAADLLMAEREGFTLGVKLVRGAYLATEERGLIHDTKQDTDSAYDGIAAALIRGRWEGTLGKARAELLAQRDSMSDRDVGGSGSDNMARVDLLLAGHNQVSVTKALELRRGRLAQAASMPPSDATSAPPLGDVAFAQLQGMADEVSCMLLAEQRRGERQRLPSTTPSTTPASSSSSSPTASTSAPPSLNPNTTQTVTTAQPQPEPHVFKYCNWGTLPETLAYLLRRADENRDAVMRTEGTRRAMAGEVVRRMRGLVGLR